MIVKLNIELGPPLREDVEDALVLRWGHLGELPVLRIIVGLRLVRQGESRRVKVVYKTEAPGESVSLLASGKNVSKPVGVEVPPQLQEELDSAMRALVLAVVETYLQLLSEEIDTVLPGSVLMSSARLAGRRWMRHRLRAKLVIPRPIHNVPKWWWNYA